MRRAYSRVNTDDLWQALRMAQEASVDRHNPLTARDTFAAIAYIIWIALGKPDDDRVNPQ